MIAAAVFSMDFQSEMKSTGLNGNKDVKMLGAASVSTLRKKGRFKKYIAKKLTWFRSCTVDEYRKLREKKRPSKLQAGTNGRMDDGCTPQ